MDMPVKDMQIQKDYSSKYIAGILGFLFIGSAYVLLVSNPVGARSKPFFSFQGSRCNCQSSTISNMTTTSPVTSHRDALESGLAEASTANKTLIIAMVNKAYVEGDKPMLDMFLDSFWLGEDTRDLINHLLLVAVDQTAYERCKFLRLHCYKLETDGVAFDGEKVYMSDDFIKMMWRRTLLLGDILKRGYNFIFTDTDVMWLRNPFPKLVLDGSVDFQISTDKFNRDEWSEANPINTGFYMIRSNNKTIELFDSWYARKDRSVGQKEQDVLDSMMRQGVFRNLGLRVRFLDTLYFSGFCQDSGDIRAVTTVHANCCRTISAKIADLTAVLRQWKSFKNSPPANETTYGMLNNHVACRDSWR
ncbi:uncharacterized protein At1g28695 [Ricinus communis]|uniref:Pentatricopeptide repeat-containing protein, putative n=1 Tax=Ricinus communis TaxID=3988 RepID=B9RA21_RICCO|nr:uncharacterized protein At1g28695 [Ricinus communis]EEF51648.1 pentatricopeptide repeat-containing protein, putative [Ricinus communis]|eukprot:XP_002511046.3 uncharacterized protein At1g28695 [Ricinus communis]